MEPEAVMSIDELASAAGLTRRAIRFYVQQKLLPLPLGKGRGRHYDRSHLEQLRTIGELQSAGYSLDAIRRILSGDSSVERPEPRRRVRPLVSSQLWTRVQLADGIELHFDAQRFSPGGETLSKIRELTRELFQISDLRSHEGGIDGNDRA